jgi:Uma2 family endonuclease
MAEPVTAPMSVEEFLDWQERQEDLYELVDGVPVPRWKAMTGATKRHDRIVVNAIIALGNKLRGGPCRPMTADIGTRTASNLRRPDLTVECGSYDPVHRESSAPVLVLEVLSPSTEGIDRLIKLEEYKAMPTLRHILLAEPGKAHVLLYSRHDDGPWSSMSHIGPDSSLDLPAIGCSLSLAELYEDVPGAA